MSLSARQLSVREFGYLIGQIFAVVACVIGLMQYLVIMGTTRIHAHLDGKSIEAPLIIDGRRMGTTPYVGSLAMGMHTIWVLPPHGSSTAEPQFEFEVTSIIHGAILDANFHSASASQATRPPDALSPR